MLGKFGYFCRLQGFCYYKSEQTQLSLASSPFKLFQSLGSKEEFSFYFVAFTVVYIISIIVKVVLANAVFGFDNSSSSSLAMFVEFMFM
jgi:hypothetical protein